jgi:hypothetical protein
LLLEAKGQVAHGQWLLWLKANVAFSERTAQGYMTVARRWEELEAKAQRVADLPFRDAVKLLAAPAQPEADVQDPGFPEPDEDDDVLPPELQPAPPPNREEARLTGTVEARPNSTTYRHRRGR